MAEAINVSKERLRSAYRKMPEAAWVKHKPLTPEMLIYKAASQLGLTGEEASKLTKEALNLLARQKRKRFSPRT
ncbi:MAG: hypothetical protein DRJ69_02800, partial [Thermoprotei archaeon]